MFTFKIHAMFDQQQKLERGSIIYLAHTAQLSALPESILVIVASWQTNLHISQLSVLFASWETNLKQS
jgi:hypothetical protein